ncbi:unnamed protein product [Mesocestoides corti]|uniref:Calmodulin n=1 Tax=Mesocestoides corti TaxID=53468 RepID=A0A0R3U606_MESCO|nr:unnamed protein product [Mesocestoides corti]
MPPKLAVYITEERLVEYEEAFQSFDEEGQGKVPCEFILPCMRKVGLMPSECEIEDLLRSVDTDNTIFADGFSYEQFCQIASKKEKDIYTEEDIQDAFRLFDSNSDGYLTMQKLMQILCTLGEKLNEPEVTALINTAGPDPEGRIDYVEFVHRMMARD